MGDATSSKAAHAAAQNRYAPLRGPIVLACVKSLLQVGFLTFYLQGYRLFYRRYQLDTAHAGISFMYSPYIWA